MKSGRWSWSGGMKFWAAAAAVLALVLLSQQAAGAVASPVAGHAGLTSAQRSKQETGG